MFLLFVTVAVLVLVFVLYGRLTLVLIGHQRFAAFAPGLPAGLRGVSKKQRRPATNTAEVKGRVHIGVRVERKGAFKKISEPPSQT